MICTTLVLSYARNKYMIVVIFVYSFPLKKTFIHYTYQLLTIFLWVCFSCLILPFLFLTMCDYPYFKYSVYVYLINTFGQVYFLKKLKEKKWTSLH